MESIAVLLTCYNRRDITLKCLNALFNCSQPNDIEISTYLVDDGSTDGTAEAVSREYPGVKIIKGNGNLFWNQGMRLAWENAKNEKDYDYYLWLNDDTILDYNSLVEITDLYKELMQNLKIPAIICGACRTNNQENVFSYGGRTDQGPVIPNGQLQQCKYINGNAVLIARDIYNSIGNLSNDYTHVWGDIDYGLRASKKQYPCYTTRSYIAVCPPNKEVPDWCNPKIPFKKRWQLFHSPKGLNIREYIKYRKKFWGLRWILDATKAYLKVISPQIYALVTIKIKHFN